MTNGGHVEPSGERERRARLRALLAYALVGSVFAAVNAVSELDERARFGRPVDSWEPWVWEFSSLAGFFLIAPLILQLSQRLWPPRLTWIATIAVHLLLSVPASLAHVGIMVGLRHATYTALGDSYSGAGSATDVLIYEYRKDVVTYALLVLLPHIMARLFRDRSADLPDADTHLEVRDGTRTVRLYPAEIDWAQAAGNYVELRGAFGSLLHRATLATLEKELAQHGFARVHRSRLVRTGAVRTIQTKPSGDFDITLASGERVGGSRRFRSNLA